MSNVASLENSKRLYELSGWDGTRFVRCVWSGGTVQLLYMDSEDHRDMSRSVAQEYIPAYDCGYLLRKLPHNDEYSFPEIHLDETKEKQIWFAGYEDTGREEYGYKLSAFADTPEDTLCLLAIKLFEQGILTNKLEEE